MSGLNLWNRRQLLLRSISSGLLLVLGFPDSAVAHPFHISTAEVEYDARTDRLQVSLKLQAIDLEQMLSRLAGERVSIEQADMPTHAADFLRRNFYVTSAHADSDVPPAAQTLEPASLSVSPQSGNSTEDPTAPKLSVYDPSRRSQVHWVGHELKGAWLWLYFELELPTHREALRLFNTVLFETNDSQINTISIRHGSLRTSLKLTPKEPSADFESHWLQR